MGVDHSPQLLVVFDGLKKLLLQLVGFLLKFLYVQLTLVMFLLNNILVCLFLAKAIGGLFDLFRSVWADYKPLMPTFNCSLSSRFSFINEVMSWPETMSSVYIK